MAKSTNRSTPVLPVYIALGLLIISMAAFMFELIRSSAGNDQTKASNEAELSADSYMDIVTPLLAKGDATRGAQLIVEKKCHSCHVIGAENKLAPSFEGVADRAKIRRPPLQPAAYIYESIIHPTAYEVKGYTGEMPRNFGEMPEQDLADIIAFLMTKTRNW